MRIKFVCPSCKHNILRKVSIDIIEAVNKNNAGKSISMETIVDVFHYACAHCGFVIKITSPVELFDWLEEHNMLE